MDESFLVITMCSVKHGRRGEERRGEERSQGMKEK